MNQPRHRVFQTLLTALLCAACAAAHADLLALRGQENLSGSLLEVSGGTLVFQTRYAGLLVVPVAEVASLQTAGPWRVEMVDGAAYTGVFFTEEGRIQLARGDRPAVPAPLSRIARVERATAEDAGRSTLEDGGAMGEEALSLDTGLWHRWTGETARAEPFARLKLRDAADGYYLAASGLLTLDGGDAFPRYADVVADMRLDRGGRYMTALQAGLARDADRALALRGEAGIGLARAFRGEAGELLASGGVAIAASRFDSGLLTDYPGAFGEDIENLAEWHYYHLDAREDDRTDIELFLRLQHRQPVSARLELRNDLRLYPSLTHAGRMRGRLESRLRWLVSPRLSVDLELMVDYLNDPPFPDVPEWSSSLGAGLSWDF